MAHADRFGEDVAAGRRALLACEWAEARDAFERAAAAGAGPVALEGLAQAAFMLNDPAVALDARERAYAGYRKADKSVEAARVAVALAWDYRAYRGEPAVSDGWLARARRLLSGGPPTAELGWLELREASFALPEDPAGALASSARAEELGRALGDLDLEMTASAVAGLALVGEGEVAAGMARLDEASAAATAGEMRDPIAIGLSCCYLIFACERVRDFDRAGQWCQRLEQMTAEQNVQALRAVCRAHYGTVLMLRGEWQRADVELTEAAAVLAISPRESADVCARLAELRRRQGRTAEAAAMLARAEHHPLGLICRGALALDAGCPDAAVGEATRCLRLLGGAQTDRAPALELLAEGQAAAGRATQSLAAAAELAEIAERAGTDPLRGAERYAAGCGFAAAGDAGAALEAFEDAVEMLERAGLPFEGARARVGLASVLRTTGRSDSARGQLERACEQLAALGAVAELQRARRPVAGHDRATSPLTPREREVLGLVAHGKTNAEIAAALVLSEHTIHRHVANILGKLGVSSRAAAVAAAASRDLL